MSRAFGQFGLTSRRLTIGAVVFCDADGYVELMGDPRVAALKAFYERKPIPGGLRPCADWYHRADFPRLEWHDVDWSSAGRRVTGWDFQ